VHVSARGIDLLGLLANVRLVRQAVDGLLRAGSRRVLAALDRPCARASVRTLLGLVHRAQKTRFGIEHDFRRIRTAADFRRLVPLRTPEELGRAYGPAGPAGVTPAVQGAHRSALRTALALVHLARPRARLLHGRLLWLADDPREPGLRERLPVLLRPYVHTLAGSSVEAALAGRDVTCLAGPVESLLPLVQQVKRQRGETRLDRIWPNLTAVLYARRSPDSPVADLRAEAREVLLLETLLRPEGPVAVEDPRHGGLRLLLEHGVYFEFVHAAEGARLGLDEVQVGKTYELVMTSCAGVWACRVGLNVCLERLDPPVVRLVPAPARALGANASGSPGRGDAGGPDLPGRAPRPQTNGIPAGPPRSYVHSPWSIPVDRG
jgi:hypothetical protein